MWIYTPHLTLILSGLSFDVFRPGEKVLLFCFHSWANIARIIFDCICVWVCVGICFCILFCICVWVCICILFCVWVCICILICICLITWQAGAEPMLSPPTSSLNFWFSLSSIASRRDISYQTNILYLYSHNPTREWHLCLLLPGSANITTSRSCEVSRKANPFSL